MPLFCPFLIGLFVSCLLNLEISSYSVYQSFDENVFFKYFISFFEREHERERENTSRGSGRGSGRLSEEKHDVVFDPRTLGSRLEPKADA